MRRDTEPHRAQAVSRCGSAAAQEIVELINRIDSDANDPEAVAALSQASRLISDAFTVEVVALLHVDALQLERSCLLEALVGVANSEFDAQLKSVCLAAVRGHWSAAVGCTYLSQHGAADDVDPQLVEAIVFRSAPSGGFMSTPGDPAALLHYFATNLVAVEPSFETF